MSDVAKTRQLVDLVLSEAGVAADADTVTVVLMTLESHFLLADFPGEPAEYHERVQRAYAEALKATVKGDT